MHVSRWYETAAITPPERIVVLGWWTPLVFGAVVRRNGRQWFEPGYCLAEARTPPRFWTLLPDPLDPPLPEARA